MLTCVTCTCYVTSWVGWDGVCQRSRLGLGGVCQRTCKLASHAHATSRLGLGGVGCVNVHVNLRHMHMLRHVWVSPCWHHNCRIRTDVDTDVKLEQDLVTCRH